MACELGADPEYVIAYARNIKPVNNRLEVVSYQDYTQINDAYSSNPAGFLSALEVLRDLPGERKILLTPGMVDLGNKQYEENYNCLLYTSPSPRDATLSRMPSSA